MTYLTKEYDWIADNIIFYDSDEYIEIKNKLQELPFKDYLAVNFYYKSIDNNYNRVGRHAKEILKLMNFKVDINTYQLMDLWSYYDFESRPDIKNKIDEYIAVWKGAQSHDNFMKNFKIDENGEYGPEAACTFEICDTPENNFEYMYSKVFDKESGKSKVHNRVKYIPTNNQNIIDIKGTVMKAAMGIRKQAGFEDIDDNFLNSVGTMFNWNGLASILTNMGLNTEKNPEENPKEDTLPSTEEKEDKNKIFSECVESMLDNGEIIEFEQMLKEAVMNNLVYKGNYFKIYEKIIPNSENMHNFLTIIDTSGDPGGVYSFLKENGVIENNKELNLKDLEVFMEVYELDQDV